MLKKTNHGNVRHAQKKKYGNVCHAQKKKYVNVTLKKNRNVSYQNGRSSSSEKGPHGGHLPAIKKRRDNPALRVLDSGCGIAMEQETGAREREY
jgi:hypothetical protein